MTWQEWHGAVGTEFRLPDDAGTTWRLAACSGLTTSGGYDTWDVTFTAPPGPAEQRTYPLHHETLGELAVFAVPHAVAPDGSVTYLATFAVASEQEA